MSFSPSASLTRPVSRLQEDSSRLARFAPRFNCPNWSRVFSYLFLSIYMIIIGTVSCYDMLLTIRYAESLRQLELNPIGRWLMRLDHIPNNSIPDVTNFLIAKGLGTVFVLWVIWIITRRRARIGHPVGFGVSLCQLALVLYLCYGTTE